MLSTGKNSNAMQLIEEHLKIIEDKTGVSGKLIVGVLFASVLFTLIGYFDHYITTLVGIILPAYWSMKAIETKQSDDDKQWLTYWIVFALFTLLDLFSGFILRFIPFYFFFKLIFLIWCFMPNTRGAIFVYNNIISKLFKKYEKQLDNLTGKIVERVDKTVKETKDYIKDNQGEIINAGIQITSKINDAAKTD